MARTRRRARPRNRGPQVILDPSAEALRQGLRRPGSWGLARPAAQVGLGHPWGAKPWDCATRGGMSWRCYVRGLRAYSSR